jgi:uncharacterized phage protein (TIGR01671 family)
MVREIKFRGWLTKLKMMFSAEEMATDQLTLLTTGQFINVSGAHTWESQIHPVDKFIPLQYTGLKDKNGKEIYEGDIIAVDLEDVDKLENMEVKWCEDCCGFTFGTKDNSASPNFYGKSNYCAEIIGNIYENPELSEASK